MAVARPGEPAGDPLTFELELIGGSGVAVARPGEPADGSWVCIWTGGVAAVVVDGSIVANDARGSTEEQAASNSAKAPAERPKRAARRMNSLRFREDAA